MNKGVLYDFRKGALRYAKNSHKPYLYQSDVRVNKDEMKIGNYYFMAGNVKVMLFKINPDNNEFSFKNGDKEITLYYHNLGMHFEDESGTKFLLGKPVFKLQKGILDEFDTGFMLKITHPDKVYLEITPEGIVKVV